MFDTIDFNFINEICLYFDLIHIILTDKVIFFISYNKTYKKLFQSFVERELLLSVSFSIRFLLS